MQAANNGKFYYGWVIAVTLAITETVSWGILFYSFSVFITPMEAELGWSRGQLTGGFSLMLLVMAAMAYPVGAWLDKNGSRLLMTAGSIGASLLLVAWSRVETLTAFYFVWAGLGICAAAVLYDPAFAVIATWFRRRRGAALTIVTFAAGLASTIFIPLADALLRSLGWRDAVFVLAILLAVITIPLHALFLRRRPDDLGLRPDGDVLQADETPPPDTSRSLSDALHSRFFWLLIFAFSLSYLSDSTIRVHLIPYLIDIGVDSSFAAFAAGGVGLMQVVGRVIFAPLEMRFSGRTMVTGIFGLQAISIGFLLGGSSLVLIGAFIIMAGMAFGARTLARPAILAELFGSRNYGRISSVMMIFLTLSSTVAPVTAGLLYDHFQSYTPVLWIVLLLAAAATAIMFTARFNARHTPPD